MESKFQASHISLTVEFPGTAQDYLIEIENETIMNNSQDKISFRISASTIYEGPLELKKCTINFSFPAFNIEEEYSKEQWLYAKIFSIHKKIIFGLDRNGVIKNVLNSKDILDNWMVVKKDILKIYQEDSVKNIIQNFDANIMANFQLIYKSDALMQWLCNDIFHTYKSIMSPVVVHKVITGHFGNNPVKIVETKYAGFANTEKIMIKVEGVLMPDDDSLPFINEYLYHKIGDIGKHDYSFSYAGNYQFNPEKKIIEEALLTVTGSVTDKYFKKTSFKLKNTTNGKP